VTKCDEDEEQEGDQPEHSFMDQTDALRKLAKSEYDRMKDSKSQEWDAMMEEAYRRVDAGEDEQLIKEVDAKIEREMTIINEQYGKETRKRLETVWQYYDQDGNGSLDRDELKLLIVDYLKECSAYNALFVEKKIMRKMKVKESRCVGTEEESQKRLAKAKKIVRKYCQKYTNAYFKELMTQKSILAMFGEMDGDNNSGLDKEEFVSSFMEVLATRCGDKMLVKIIKAVKLEIDPQLYKIYVNVLKR